MNSVIFLMTIIVIVLTLPMLMNSIMTTSYKENFATNKKFILGSGPSSYPYSLSNFLLKDSFPIRQNPGQLDKDGLEQASKMWWHKPVFKEGSYAQITNNIRYFDNPDIGNCTAEDLCGTIYKNRKTKSNYVIPLPPINHTCGNRIGYFTTGINLLPFRTNIPNVLY